MAIVWLIVAIIFAVVTARDRKKKAAIRAGKPQGLATEPTRSAHERPTSPRPVSDMSLYEREARLEELRRKRAERAAEPVMPSNAASSFESSLSELRELLEVASVAPTEGESMLDDADCHGGSMPHVHTEGHGALEDEECAGGSMAHSHTQGVSRSAMRHRLEELDREEASEARREPAAIDAQALRRAVVMAEVLGRPKALRQRRV